MVKTRGSRQKIVQNLLEFPLANIIINNQTRPTVFAPARGADPQPEIPMPNKTGPKARVLAKEPSKLEAGGLYDGTSAVKW